MLSRKESGTHFNWVIKHFERLDESNTFYFIHILNKMVPFEEMKIWDDKKRKEKRVSERRKYFFGSIQSI